MSSVPGRSDDVAESSSAVRRWRLAAKRWGFVMVSSLIVVVSSEKFYWYPQGFPRLDNLELIAVYAIGVLSFFMAARHFGLDDLPSIILGSAVFSLVVEGAVTPVMYEDGPLPVLALYFLGWHGLLSIGVGWYGIRRLALEHRHVALTVMAMTWGLIVGTWSTVYWAPTQIDEMRSDADVAWDYGQWSVAKFGLYMLLMTAVLVVAHWVLGRLWVDDWAISRGAGRVVIGLVVVGVGLWTLGVLYAPLKFALCAWLVRWLVLRSSRRGCHGRSHSSVFEELAGQLRLRDLAPVSALAPVAVASYGAMTLLAPSASTLDALYWVIVLTTLTAGTGAIVWAYRARAFVR